MVEAPKPAPARVEDPNGPSAKTAELKPPAAQTNGTASVPASRTPRVRRRGVGERGSSGEGIQSAVEADASPTAIAGGSCRGSVAG